MIEYPADAVSEGRESDPAPVDPLASGGIHLRADASNGSQINQAGRDLHIHHQIGGGRTTRSVRPGGIADECPYPGLAAFDSEHARWFFGRETLTADLLERVDERLRHGGVQVVVASSGAGKTSLLRAGLQARLAVGALPGSAEWHVESFTPTEDPLSVLRTRMARIIGCGVHDLPPDPRTWGTKLRAARVGRAPALLIIDQFEELFTLCADEEQRRAFVESLTGTAETAGGARPAALVVIGVRDDFHGACARHPQLVATLQDRPVVIGPMAATELRAAILAPAQACGLDVEAGLVDLLLRDFGSDGPERYPAGRLPLLAHALRSTWQQRHGATLTVEGYQDTGGISRAVATTADNVYRRLPEAGRPIARSLFLRLVRVGDDVEDVRRRVPRTALTGSGPDSKHTAAVIDAFIDARLLSLSQDAVEITHEALLKSWPLLREWINSDRAGRLIHQGLEEAASEWERHSRDKALLYRGSRLHRVNEWAAGVVPGELGGSAGTFLAAANRYERRKRNVVISVATCLVLLLIVALAATVVSLVQRDKAAEQRNLAIFHRVAAEAARLRQSDVSLAAQLDLVAHQMRPDAQTGARLVQGAHSALSVPSVEHAGAIFAVATRPVGRVLATAGEDRGIRLWDYTERTEPLPVAQPVEGHGGKVYALAFSPDGRLLATGGEDRALRLWDVGDPTRPTGLPPVLDAHGGSIRAVAFSADGTTVLSAGDDGAVRFWNVTGAAHPVRTAESFIADADGITSIAVRGNVLATAGKNRSFQLWNISDPTAPSALTGSVPAHTGVVSTVALSPDGRTLVTAGDDQAIRVWDVGDPARPTALGAPLPGNTGAVLSVAFSPDGEILAAVGGDHSARLWNVSNPAAPMPITPSLTGHAGAVWSVAFSPEGDTLMTGSHDHAVRVWRLPPLASGHRGPVLSAAFSRDGRTLVTTSEDQTVRLWDTTDPTGPAPLGPPLRGHVGAVLGAVFVADDQIIVTTGIDGELRLWNVADRIRPTMVGRTTAGDEGVLTLAVSPNGKVLATAGEDRAVRLWDISDPARPTPFGIPLTGHNGGVWATTFSPDGSVLATAGEDKTIRLWDTTDPSRAHAIGPALTGHTSIVRDLAFTPDGGLLASVSGDNTFRLWDTTTPERTRAIGLPVAGHTGIVSAAAFTPDGTTLATAGADQTVRLWDITDSRNPTPLSEPLIGHTKGVLVLTFTRDGRTAVTAGTDRTIHLWRIDVTESASSICASSRLTEDQWRQYVSTEIPYTPPCQ